MTGQNHYSELLRFIKSVSDADGYPNTLTQGIEEDMDLDKGNIFPIHNIEIFDAGLPNNGVSFTVQLTALDIRDLNKEINTDKFLLNDNKIDNHTETFAFINRIANKMMRDFDGTDIVMEIPSAIEIVTNWGLNDLDGWSLTAIVTMPNTTINLCS
jgi:hypothetical protein